MSIPRIMKIWMRGSHNKVILMKICASNCEKQIYENDLNLFQTCQLFLLRVNSCLFKARAENERIISCLAMCHVARKNHKATQIFSSSFRKYVGCHLKHKTTLICRLVSVHNLYREILFQDP